MTNICHWLRLKYASSNQLFHTCLSRDINISINPVITVINVLICLYLLHLQKRMNLTKTVSKTPIDVNLDLAGPVYHEQQHTAKTSPKYDEEHLWVRGMCVSMSLGLMFWRVPTKGSSCCCCCSMCWLWLLLVFLCAIVMCSARPLICLIPICCSVNGLSTEGDLSYNIPSLPAFPCLCFWLRSRLMFVLAWCMCWLQ